MPRGQGGRQAQFSHYDPALKNRPRAAPSGVCGPSFSLLSCRPPSAALCWRSLLPRSSSAAPPQGCPVRQPRRSRGPHPRGMLRGARIRYRPSAHVRRRSPSEPSACRIDGEARHPPPGSTARGSSTGRTGGWASSFHTAPTRSMNLAFCSGFGHVGIYLGRGRMVHAPHSGSRVQVVRLGHSSYGGRLVGVRRMANP
jgi:hypothetical protein